jgi:polysaccharide export outer membrane protein
MNTPNSSPSARAVPHSAGTHALSVIQWARHLPRAASLAVVAGAAVLLSGCATADSAQIPAVPHEAVSQTLRPGDVIKISFPRAPTLDTTQQIRRDGRINLYLVGEVQAVDLTPAELEKQLMDKYSAQLVSKELRVTVVSSAFTVYVTGAVVHPGRIAPEREMTAIEAVMEAGGFDPVKANTKSVSVIRQDGAQTKNFQVNLQAVLEGKDATPFYLKPNDIIYVPEKHSIF